LFGKAISSGIPFVFDVSAIDVPHVDENFQVNEHD
jgi:hypothetical protein